MSNVIKAYSVRYSEDKRIIDMNERAEEKIRLLFAKLNGDGQETSGEFVEGLNVRRLTVDPDARPDDENGLNPEELTSDEEQMLFGDAGETRAALEAEAEAVLEDAKIKAEEIINVAKAEAEALKQSVYEEARADGNAKGRAEAEKEYKKRYEELEILKNDIRHQNELEKKKLEPEIIDMVCNIVKKLTGVLIDDRRDIVEYLVEQALLNIEHSNTYLIRVSKDDYDIIASRKAELMWKIKEGAEIEVVDDPLLSKTQCLIETDSRIIDCSLDVQLRNLTADLKMLAGSAGKNK